MKIPGAIVENFHGGLEREIADVDARMIALVDAELGRAAGIVFNELSDYVIWIAVPFRMTFAIGVAGLIDGFPAEDAEFECA